MILDIDKITLELVRGDTFELPLPINCGSREEFIPYFLSPDDFLYIGIMKPSQPFEHAEVRAMLDCRSPKDSFGNVIFMEWIVCAITYFVVSMVSPDKK